MTNPVPQPPRELRAKMASSSVVLAAKSRYQAIRPFVPAGAFVGGFAWDSLTLKRIDNTLDLMILLAYLALAGFVIVAMARQWKFRLSHYLPAAIQFLFGGLFSAFVVFYFKSAASFLTGLFVILLFVALVVNEFLESRFHRLRLTTTLFGVCCLMFVSFGLPVMLKAMNAWVFVLGVVLCMAVMRLVQKVSNNPDIILGPLLVIYIVATIAYFLNIIPPVPLSKKHMGIYRSVGRKNGSYVCTMERPSLLSFWRKGEKNFRYAIGDTVFCFASIFAPYDLEKKVYYHWCRYNDNKGRYKQTDRMGYRITGGREGGYRGYTFKRYMQPGRWKVYLKTDNGKTIGIVKFRIVPREKSKPIKKKILEW